LPQRRAKHGGSNQPPQRPENSGRFEQKIGTVMNSMNAENLFSNGIFLEDWEKWGRFNKTTWTTKIMSP
jgi:hypothetical protein